MDEHEARPLGERWKRAGGGWAPGMLIRYGDRGLAIDVHRVGGADGRDRQRPLDDSPWWPDFRDAATRGAALEVVRERWGDPLLYVRAVDDGSGWEATSPDNTMEIVTVAWGATEAEALVAALEAAPA